MTRPTFINSPQAWMRTQRTSSNEPDYASALEVHRKPKEPLGWIVCRWLSAFILVCMAGALAFGY